MSLVSSFSVPLCVRCLSVREFTEQSHHYGELSQGTKKLQFVRGQRLDPRRV